MAELPAPQVIESPKGITARRGTFQSFVTAADSVVETECRPSLGALCGRFVWLIVVASAGCAPSAVTPTVSNPAVIAVVSARATNLRDFRPSMWRLSGRAAPLLG
ncbi:hypothetical protein GCM10010319_53980 [Streptomyces blastmyceticus]|uniref:Uncharacterized protein n=1 Tax=Streptomyces blastmyceticus TaxID=68180 RepID=A0ABN0XP58_9ACTN